MPAYNSISVEKLFRLVGTVNCPAIVDIRPEAEELLPASQRRPAESVTEWAGAFAGHHVVVTCVHGQERSAGVAAVSAGLHQISRVAGPRTRRCAPDRGRVLIVLRSRVIVDPLPTRKPKARGCRG